MKFTLNWLKDFLDTDVSLEEITTALTNIGLEVEEVINPAEKLKGFVVAEVKSCTKHPDADRLNVVKVDIGEEELQIVCGAPNCREGLKGVFAPTGSYITGLGVTLKKAKIRGVESNGMLCSERELELSDEHKGIIELPQDSTVGSCAAAAIGLDDIVIDIALTPNRGDCAGIFGIARDLAAAGIGKLKEPKFPNIEENIKTNITVDIKEDAKDACYAFIGREIRNVKNAESPKWLQQRLKAIGLRPISALVDITNYFTISFARPLHVYDADKLNGNIHVCLSKLGEELDALDDKSYKLEDGMTVICDDSSVLGLGGIVGGVPSSVSEDTKNIYLECAYFNPVAIAMTGRKLQIDSDARYRFERGIDPNFMEQGEILATEMILNLCGGQAGNAVMAGKIPTMTKKIQYCPNIVKKYGGIEITEDRQREILNALGFKIGDNFEITTPSWRPDIDGKADIVEEILRIYGYDKIEPVQLSTNDNLQPILDIRQKRLIKAKRTLAMRGMAEAVTWSFMSSKFVDLFGMENKESLTITNPISSELDVMRPSLLPNLIDAANRNVARGHGDIALFEVANSYKTPNADGHIMTIGAVRCGMKYKRHWTHLEREVDVFDIKADAIAALQACSAPDNLQIISNNAPNWYHPARSGSICLGKNILAYFGELHPAVLDKMDIDYRMVAFEIFPDNIPVAKKQTGYAKKTLEISSLQPAKRDFAFIVDKDVNADKLVRAVKSADKKLIVHVDIFDIYTGVGVAEDKKSVALYVILQPFEKTLTDSDFEEISKKIIANVEKQTGANLRA